MTLGEYCKLSLLAVEWIASESFTIYFICFSFYVSGLPTGRDWSNGKRYSAHVTPVNGMVGTDTRRPWLHDQANNIPGKLRVNQYIHPPMFPSVNCDFLFLMTAACKAYLAWNIENFSSTPTLLPCFFQRLVSSVGRASDCCVGGRGFEPQTGPTLRFLK